MPRKTRVLLLNPPSARPVGRDLFLGVRTEGGLCLPPAELACLSGRLRPRFDAAVLDAAAEGLSPAQARARAAAAEPDAVVFLAAGVTYAEDAPFLAGLDAALPAARFIGIGDLYRDVRELAFSLQPFLDAVLLDATTPDLLACLDGAEGPVENMITRSPEGLARGADRRRRGAWDLPLPAWELFPLKRYRWPFSAPGPAAAVMTDYGCPYACTYCPQSELGHKSRPVAAVVEELRALAALGVKSVFFRDQTFGFDGRRAGELLSALTKARLGLKWTCSTRVDLAEKDLFRAMKAAGCAAVLFGVDSGDDEVLRAYKKNTTRAQALRAVELARAAGLKAWGQFLIGLSMDTRQTIEATLELARELPLDHASFALEAQRHALDHRRDMLVRGLVPPEAMPPDVPTTVSVWQGRLGVSTSDALKFIERARACAAPKAQARSRA